MSGLSISRKIALPVATMAAFAAGAASHHLWPRDAHAQAGGSASTIYLPAEGLVFRTLDGKAIARLSRDPSGGVFELYDDYQEPAARLSAATTGASAPTARVPRAPYVLDEEDPFKGR